MRVGMFGSVGSFVTAAGHRPALRGREKPAAAFPIFARPKSLGSNILAAPRCPPHLFAVHLAHLRLRDFRNYARLDVDFAPGFHLLLGDNAQGKTNILEAIYLMATLRSFRGVGSAQMIRVGAKGYFVGGTVIAQGQSEIKMYWSAAERNLNLNGRPVK
jgi:hypothetical protein